MTTQPVTCEDCRAHLGALAAAFRGNLVVMLAAMAVKLRTDSQTVLRAYLQVRHENGHTIWGMDPDDILARLRLMIST